jgi:hypothetical protein
VRRLRPAIEWVVGDVPGGLVLRGAGVAGAVAEGGQDPLPRPRQRRQDHPPAHAQGRGWDKITFFSLSLSKLLVLALPGLVGLG